MRPPSLLAIRTRRRKPRAMFRRTSISRIIIALFIPRLRYARHRIRPRPRHRSRAIREQRPGLEIRRQRQQRAMGFGLQRFRTLIHFRSVGCAVVQVQADEGEHEAERLDFGDGFAKPDDGEDDDEDTLDEAGDGVCDGRDHGEQDEGDDVLAEVEGAVEEEFDEEAAVVECARVVGQLDGGVVEEVEDQREAFGPEPEREREHEC